MRFMTTLILGTTLALPAMAQTRHHVPAKPHHAMARQSAEDNGPFTPEANRAYQGGGVILEGAPGGPPPPASDAVMPTRR